MHLLHIFSVFLIIQKSFSEFLPSFQLFHPPSAPLLPLCPPTKYQTLPLPLQPVMGNVTDLEKSRDNLKFVLPFLDMEIQCDRNLHVIHETKKQQVYILHGQELYQLFVDRLETRLSFMGVLAGNVRHVEPLGAQIISWRSNFLLVIALDEVLEIYQLAKNILTKRAEAVKDPARSHEAAPVFEPIQKLTLTGKFQKLFLFSPSEDRLMIVAAVNFTKLYGKLRIFEWFNTYFDPIEEITVPAMHVVNVIGWQTKYLIMGKLIKQQSTTVLTIYEINPKSLNLSIKQTLTVESPAVHIFSYRHRNMIVACAYRQQKCISFRQMSDGQFGVYRQRTSREFAFDHLVSSRRFIATSRGNQIMVFTNHRLDCYGSFLSDERDVTNLIGFQNANKEDFLLTIYKRPYKTLVRIVSLEMNAPDFSTGNQSEPEETQTSNRHVHLFELKIGQLRSLLLKRKSDMDMLRKVSKILRPQLKDVEVKTRTSLRAGNVGIIKIVGESLSSPMQIMHRIENIKQNYSSHRSKRADNQNHFNVSLEDTSQIKVQRLKVENLIYKGDVMEGFSLNLTNLQHKVLTIKPKVRSRTLNVSEPIRNARHQSPADLFSDSTFSIRAIDLSVDSINGVPWNAFYDSLFLKNRDKVIEGRLVLQAAVKVEHLTATILNGLVVSQLFNLKQPQAVDSNLVISRIFAQDLKATTVNGLIFEEDIVFSGEDAIIETPVIMNHLKISGNLILANGTKAEGAVRTPEGIEFEQFYIKKIIVNGSLIVNNLKRLNNETKLVLDDKEFNEREIKEKYLMRNQAQNFSFPVVFAEAKVTTPFLQTVYLNDHPTEQHMLVDKVNAERALMLVFMNAQVKGDLICRDYKSKIAEIKENIIEPGDKVNITGWKIFEGPLEINKVEVTTLNQLAVENLVFKTLLNANDSIKFKDAKEFSKIKVKNPAAINKELKAAYLNNLPLENLLNNDYYMDRLTIGHFVEASNLVFHKINGISFEEFFTKLDIVDDRLVLHKDLIVEGNVQFAEPVDLQSINGMDWNEYVRNLVHVNENAVIEGEVWFNEDLSVTKKLEMPEINGHNLEFILKNVLLKNQPQLITGHYNFGHLRGSNIDVSFVNGVNALELIDLRTNFTEIEADVIVENLSVEGNLQGYFEGFEYLWQMKGKLQQMPFKPWKNIYVLKNASWPVNVFDNSLQELLKYLYKTAVLKNRKQTITGNVRMSNPLIANMETRLKFPPNLDFEFIQKDAVLRNSSIKQSIKGEKVFLKSLNVKSLKALSNLDTKFLNEIDILRFNQSLYRLTSREPIRGPMKFLQPLKINRLFTYGLINGLDSTSIYELQTDTALPAVKLQKLYAENDLIIKNINDMNWLYFLNNRVTLKGPALEHFGHLTFENLVIDEKALIQSINGIAIDHLVFKHSPHLQTITGHKTIENTLELAGPAHVMHINDKDLMELYLNSLLNDNNYEFDHLTIKQAKFEQGLQVVQNLNFNVQQRTFEEIEEQIPSNNLKFLKFLQEFQENLNNSDQFIIYLDYDLNIPVKWLESKDELTANQTIYVELSRISCCEKRYLQISFIYPNNIYLKNVTSSRLTQSSNKILIKAENFCNHQKGKVKSKITFTGPKLLKVFGMKRFMETIYILDNINNPLEHFVILHALDLPALRRNEVRIFKISTQNNSISSWQILTRNIGEQLKYFKLSQLQILLTNGLIDHHPALTIYHFNNNSQLFKAQQVIDGDYDIMEMLEVPNNEASKQLILSCSKCQRIFIYEFVANQKPQKYEILQIITLKSPIDKLVIFSLKKSFYMLVISQPNYNFYNIYKYSYIQGWLPVTFGHFPNLQMSLPLTDLSTKGQHLMHSEISNDLPLMLLCSPKDCYVVKAII